MSEQTRYLCTMPVLVTLSVEYTGEPGLTPEQVHERIDARYELRLERAAGDTAYPEIQDIEEPFCVAEGNTVLVACSTFTIDETD